MSHPRISLIHPTSNPFARNAALALGEANLLQEAISTIAYNPKGVLSRYLNLLPQKISSRVALELGRRAWTAPPNAFMRSHPWQEVIRLALVKTKLNRWLNLGRQGPIDWVYVSLDRHVSQHHLHNLDAVYAYEDGAAIAFEVAKQRGILCL
ncbi:MAG: hypothetical protein N4J56_005359 [Chroococcidiopsis sp. SAG 2025]|uniref:hypothetical protein n=1 Tax=Chroococcidiopsis sp. SAG 2025 TaxID=171389 RepID=UPI00293715A0|nr:hypothetical protein [Chroococcidiopsis sp. SAG 2025]MDV2995705.1 hypothetical protein [Chroococcidiopsis sp. SAG 2025]